jgi:FlaA1/EpsC-like NDP-sugar epimerase
VLIYGAGTTGRQLAAAMANSHEMQVAGFLDDDDRLHGLSMRRLPETIALFETLGALMGAELLLVGVTLASKGQQLLAERRGFSLCGLVPGFDRDQQPGGL